MLWVMFLVSYTQVEEQRGHDNTSRVLPWESSGLKADKMNCKVLDAGLLCYFS